MKGRLLLLVFIIVVACNSFAAVTPHADGEGGCSTACCQNARGDTGTSTLSRLRCLMNCEQPATHQRTSPANPFAGESQKDRAPVIAIFKYEPALSVVHLNTNRPPQSLARKPISLYLQSGSILI